MTASMQEAADQRSPAPDRRRWRRPGRALLGGLTVLVLASCVAVTVVGQPAVGLRAVAPQVFDDSDPAVLVAGGATYLFGSSNNEHVPVRRITSFTSSLAASQTDWAIHPQDAMPAHPAWISPSQPQIWAPTLTKIGTKYVMWFAGHRAGAADPANDQCIGRATATSPTGPYTPNSTPIYCGLPPERGSNRWGRGALDPEAFRSAAGRLYLLVVLSRTTDNIGVVALDSAGYVVGGANAAPAILARQSFGWQDGFLENPSIYYDHHTGTYLLFYSAGQWGTSHYVTGFARCASPTGPCALDGRGPFLEGGNGRSGVGGLTVFRDPAGVVRVAYASWTAGHEGQSGSVGQYSRQVSWGRLSLTPTTDPAHQAVRLG